MEVNKVEFAGRILMDISDSTVRPEDLLKDETAYNAAGKQIRGTLVPGDMFESEYGGSAPGVVASSDKAAEAANAQTANTLLNRTGGQGHAGDWYTPPGAVMPYAGTSLPSGWLWCGGNLVSRTKYAALFKAIGTTYGAGDGKTTFALPDLRGRVVAMRGDSQSVGDTAGADSKKIAKANLPAEKLKIADNGMWLVDTAISGTRSGSAITKSSKQHMDYLYTEALGSGAAFDVRQNTIYLNYIIKY